MIFVYEHESLPAAFGDAAMNAVLHITKVDSIVYVLFFFQPDCKDVGGADIVLLKQISGTERMVMVSPNQFCFVQ